MKSKICKACGKDIPASAKKMPEVKDYLNYCSIHCNDKASKAKKAKSK